ncbi:hypothetical protein ACHAXR_008786 [Thalassiosira sp. AJA248-18]
MYQNAPYNQGGYAAASPQQQQQQYGGYYNENTMQQQQHPPAYPGGGGGGYNNTNVVGAPSPVNAAYQRANAAMAGVPPQQRASPINNINTATSSTGGGGGATTTGLIRLTLRKPMGIVFEPMTDPHNPSQQRGVRICDLPRTGAAAMSQKLEVGDELLSINDKTMSRLTFDEIMDFIIEADKERVDLLFRRPGKDKLAIGNVSGGDVSGKGGKKKGDRTVTIPGDGGGPGGALPLSPMGLAGIGSNTSNSVKWIDEKSDMGGKLTEDVARGGGGGGDSKQRDSSSRRKEASRHAKVPQDDPSVDDTYNDGQYTIESQSQYTMETYEDDRGRGRSSTGRGGGRGGGESRYSEDDSRRNNKHSRRGGGSDGKRKSSSSDPVESSGFLDLLIDTLCTSVMGRDARDMCGDRSDEGGKMKGRDRDEDDEFTIDDGTYATYDDPNDHRSNHRHRKNHIEDEESLVTEEERTFVTAEDDGTRTLESKENAMMMNKKKEQQIIKDQLHKEKIKDNAFSSKADHIPRDVDMGGGIMGPANNNSNNDDQFHHRSDPPPHGSRGGPSFDQMTAPDPPTKTGGGQSTSHSKQYHQHHHQPNAVVDILGEQESALASGIALPVKELEYDDRVDYAADVSVMESLGGPSLLVERARHENAVSSGADRASFEQTRNIDPELSELVVRHGQGFNPDPGMTKEESAFRDPYKFYEFAVCSLLQENEPEKVRLLSKLMAKYRGRERHLINKLSARYNKEKAGGGGQEGGGGNTGANADLNAAGSSSENRTKGGASVVNPSMSAMSGMEKIHEGGEDEEETAGSSALNDPSRANIAAIESAKKQLESSNNINNKNTVGGKKAQDAAAGGGDATKTKSSIDEGWPPAMSDPWGTGGDGGKASNPSDSRRSPTAHGDHEDEDDDAHSRPLDDDEGSYSDGSSYTGDEESAVDGTSPAIIAQVSELLNYVYGKTSVAGQIDRVSTIMRAYEGREAVLLELLETKALIKANADSNQNAADLPVSLRNSAGLNNPAAASGTGNNNENSTTNEQKKLTPQTPVSVLTASTMAPGGPVSPASVQSPKEGVLSPSAATMNTMNTTASGKKKKKKGMFGGFFGGKKKDKVKGGGGNFPSSGGTVAAGESTAKNTTSSPGKQGNRKKMSKKGQPLNNNDDDRSI